MSKIIECVPNFSEGTNKEVIDAISRAVQMTNGVKLLDVDPGESTNRTVYTFVGGPSEIVQAALNAATVAAKLIDMTKHKGEHPRMGALDVCPFIPIQNVTVEECIEISKIFGRKMAAALNVPVFLYGSASQKDYRKTMPQIRAGEYEGLEEKLKNEEWQPDFGPAKFVPKWGATVTGVRKFLIAYNVNILSTKEQAHRIALNLREQGRGPDQPGKLKACQAIGWYLEEQNLAQISINLTDYEITPIHVAYEEAKKDAEELKLAITGSEIVGLVPLAAVLQTADFYIKKESLFILEEEQKVHLAINRLGLSSISKFNPKERIIEYCLDAPKGRLAELNVSEFIKVVASRASAPGGGSVAAVVASLGSALGAMVGQLTYGKKQWESLDDTMRELIPPLHFTSMELIHFIDEDTNAFNCYMAALKFPKSTEDEQKRRNEEITAAIKRTVEVPLNVMRKISIVWEPLMKLAEVGNINCKSDLQMGAKCLETGSFGGYYNVLINLDNVQNEKEREEYKEEAETLLKKAVDSCMNLLKALENRP